MENQRIEKRPRARNYYCLMSGWRARRTAVVMAATPSRNAGDPTQPSADAVRFEIRRLAANDYYGDGKHSCREIHEFGTLPTVANMVDATFCAMLLPENSRNGMVSNRIWAPSVGSRILSNAI